MARQKATRHANKTNLFGRVYDPNPKATFHADRQDEMVADAEGYLKQLPKQVRNIPGAQEIVDAAITAKYLASDPRAQIGGLGAVGIGGAVAALQAHYDQQQEYLPTGPLSVAGRMVSNLNPFNDGGSLNAVGTPGVVGVDPLAAARNNINAARQIVGTENMLQALADDEVVQMRGEAKALEAAQKAMATPEDQQISRLTRDMVDSRARELMQTPIQYSDGSVRPMRYDEAVREAREQINMELRANNVY
jgi:hypothetical protein